mmetsp:Transcript_21511/g.31388  ORF Transcript_21511/g.31388 Transcript_21511/m.31388 type:complete len:98 (-) Transcript_21511:41-334(-)
MRKVLSRGIDNITTELKLHDEQKVSKRHRLREVRREEIGITASSGALFDFSDDIVQTQRGNHNFKIGFFCRWEMCFTETLQRRYPVSPSLFQELSVL